MSRATTEQQFGTRSFTGGLNTSYSGCGIQIATYLPPLEGKDAEYIVWGELSTISVSSFRESSPVRTLGRANPVTFTPGPRTIAGTIIMDIINSETLMYAKRRLTKATRNMNWPGWSRNAITRPELLKMDQLPPFDIIITMTNEYMPTIDSMVIYGAKVISSGMSISMADLVLDKELRYVALDMIEVADTGHNHHIVPKSRADELRDLELVHKSGGVSTATSWLKFHNASNI